MSQKTTKTIEINELLDLNASAGADPGGSKRGLRHGQIFEIVIFSKLVYKDGSDRYLYV